MENSQDYNAISLSRLIQLARVTPGGAEDMRSSEVCAEQMIFKRPSFKCAFCSTQISGFGAEFWTYIL